MKNALFIDVDTDRDQVVLIGKPPEIKQPENPSEASKMIFDDISCVCEALATLILISDTSGYATKKDLLRTTLQYLNDTLGEKVPEPNKEP